MANKYYQLLEELYNNYDISSGTSLNAFIKSKYDKDDGDYPTAIHLKKILEKLETKGLIKWDAEPQEEKGNSFIESWKYKGLLGTKDDEKYQTFKEIYVEVQLTTDGLDYVEDWLDRKATRESLLETNKATKLLTKLLLLVGVISIVIQATQCNVYQGQLDIQKKQLQLDTLSNEEYKVKSNISASCSENKLPSAEHNKDSLAKTSITH